MDPLTLSLIGIGVTVSCLVTFASGLAVGRKWEKSVQDSDDESLRIVQLEAELASATAYEDHYKDVINAKADQVTRLKAQRDDYRKIASSHKVTLPERGEAEVVTTEVWDSRIYRSHPRDNLVALERELAQFTGKEVVLTLAIRGRGGWRQHLEKKWHHTSRSQGYARQVPISEITGFTFEGPPERVLGEIKCLLLDDDTGLTQSVAIEKGVDPAKFSRIVADSEDEVLSGTKKAGYKLGKRLKMWRDSDSPLLFEVSLSIRETIEPPPIPTVVEVEVLRVQEEVVERIIERPVIVSIPEGSEPDLCGHTRDEITALVDAQLEVHAALAQGRPMSAHVTPEMDAEAEAITKKRLAGRRAAKRAERG